MLDRLDQVIVIVSSVALVAAALRSHLERRRRYFFQFSTDWQDELSVFLIVGAIFMSARRDPGAARPCRRSTPSWACCRRA